MKDTEGLTVFGCTQIRVLSTQAVVCESSVSLRGLLELGLCFLAWDLELYHFLPFSTPPLPPPQRGAAVRTFPLCRWMFLSMQVFVWVSKICFSSDSSLPMSQICQNPRLQQDALFCLLVYGDSGLCLWVQWQVLKSITIQVTEGSPQHSAVCSRPVLRN